MDPLLRILEPYILVGSAVAASQRLLPRSSVLGTVASSSTTSLRISRSREPALAVAVSPLHSRMTQSANSVLQVTLDRLSRRLLRVTNLTTASTIASTTTITVTRGIIMQISTLDSLRSKVSVSCRFPSIFFDDRTPRDRWRQCACSCEEAPPRQAPPPPIEGSRRH
jgi:hypothetical protein